MKTVWQWVSLCAVSVAIALLPGFAAAQTAPAIQGTSLADPAVPVVIAPAPTGSGFFVLNQDFTILQHSLVDSSQNESCNGPGIFSRTIVSPRTLVADLYNVYMSGPDGSGLNTAVDAMTPEVSCTPVQAFDYTGGLATQSLAANDPQHALYYLVSGFGGASVDQLLVLSNLNNASVSSTNKFTNATEAALDIGGVYTSLVVDTRSDFGLTAITELKTATSPGNLFIFYPQSGNVYKILGPGGKTLPAVNSFIIPAQTDGGGDLLVLVNQDGLTASNISSPPQDTAPFTIIDLGQLRPLLANNPLHNTITLPFVQQIKATTPFYAMLGAAYDPLDHRVYAVVAGGTSTSSVVENVISYDTLNPSAPNEQVVADVSNVPFSLGAYPQLALNAASGTMQILTSNPSTVYTVGISGSGNTAVVVPGSTFPDSNFQPTFIAANPLQGETYIASASGQVDVLTRPTSAQGGLTLTLTGSDLGYTSQEYDLKPLALWPVYDPSLGTAKLTITVTPQGGTPVVLATGHVADVGYPGSSFYTYTFPKAGHYVIQATAEASALYPAVTSPPLNVFVGNTGVYPTAVALSIPATAPSAAGQASLNATVTLSGSTYGPGGQVYITDTTGAQVGNISLPKGVLSNPITVPIVVGDGVQTLTAVYSGDEQNQSSKSTPQVITVGTVVKVTPAFTLTVPASAIAGASLSGNLKFTSSSTTAPTGTITIYAALAGSGTANQIATVSAASAFAPAGANFTYTAPAAGTYTISAGYGGDTSYNNQFAGNSTEVITAAPLQTTSIGIVAPSTATPGTAFNVVIGFNVQGAFSTQPTGNIVLTATVPGSAGITVGTVTPAQGMAPGGANVSVTLPNAGSYTLTANYAGDTLYAASTNSAIVTQSGFSTTLKVTTGATQKVNASFNVAVLLNATGSTATPAGNVILTATPTGGTPVTLATVPASMAFGGSGTFVSATFNSTGNYTLTATYAGAGPYLGSSGTASVTVTGLPTTLTLLEVTNPIPPDDAVVDASLAMTTPGSTTPITGTISVTTVIDGVFFRTDTFDAASIVAATRAFGLAAPHPGTFVVTATYPGDALYSPATSTVTFVVPKATTTLKLSGPSTATVGTSASFTLYLGTFISSPPGNVTLSSTLNGAAGPSVSTSGSSVNSGNGSPVTLTFTAAGTYTLQATYPGDAYSTPATSATLTVTVAPYTGPPTFTFTRDSDAEPTLTSNRTTPAVLPVTLSALNGFSSPVTLSFANAGTPDTPLTAADSAAIFVAVDHTTQKPITSVTPLPAGAHVDLLLEYSNGTYSHNQDPTLKQTIYWAFGVGFLSLIGLRKRFRRLGVPLLVTVLIVSAAYTVSGCAEPYQTVIVVTATPADKTVAPQTMQVTVRFEKPASN